MFLIGLIMLLVYGLFLIYISLNFKVKNFQTNHFNHAFSVIIPFRNEQKHLLELIASVLKQLENTKGELILVDDHSTDGSEEMLKNSSFFNQILFIKNEGQGKKNAIYNGILNSNSELILTIDADVKLKNNEIINLLNEFEQKDLNMLCGLIQFETNQSIFQELQKAESAAIVGLSMVMLTQKKPSTCNGAFLLFKKQVFLEIGGYQSHQHIASGDDDFLMHQFAHYNLNKVAYSQNINASVLTEPAQSFKSFFNQRLRWMSKSKHYKYPYNFRIQLLIIFNLLIFYSSIILTIKGDYYYSILIGLKYLFDIIYVKKLNTLYYTPLKIVFIMPFYMFYVVILLVLNLLVKPVWKGRKI